MMKTEIVHYLDSVFGGSAQITPIRSKKGLPLLLTGNFDFCECSVQDARFILMIDKKNLQLSPGEIAKQTSFAENQLGKMTVYAAENMPAYRRNRLLEKRVQFIVPGNQIFLPRIGIILHEAKDSRIREYERLSICGQEILLLFLNGYLDSPMPLTGLIDLLPYSRQTVFTALDELESFKLLVRESRGRSKVIQFPKLSHAGLTKAESLLENPVKKTVGIKSAEAIADIACDAGTTLLAQRTMLAEPVQREMAVRLKDFNKGKKRLAFVPLRDAPISLQVWVRAPLLPGQREIDNISLRLTLKHHRDERVKIALSELKEDIYAERT